jgi:hypothetical protein
MNRQHDIGRRDFLRWCTRTGLAGCMVAWIAGEVQAADPKVQLGIGASLGGRRPFPDDNPWNEDISGKPVDSNSDTLIRSIGTGTSLHLDFGRDARDGRLGIPYVVVSGRQPKVPVRFEYAEESDKGPYPIPPNAPVEGGQSSRGDRHVLVIDRDNWKLYELFNARLERQVWSATSGAIFNLSSNRMRTRGWTSADAAGLPVFPGLVRADEVFEQKAIRHALRFTCKRSRRAFVYPARHFASKRTEPNLPPMGMRVRLKASVDISPFSPEVQIILQALKKYGMFLADNGRDWYISGAPDPRWLDGHLAEMKQLKGRHLEVVQMDKIITE